MARKTFKATLGTNLGDGNYLVEAGSAPNTADPLATAVTDLDTVDTAIALAVTTTEDSAVSADAADDEAALAVGALQTAVTDAVAAAQLIGAGDASAEIDAIDTAVQALIAKTAEVKTATAAAKADALTAEAAAAAVNTTALDASLTAATSAAAGHFQINFDAAVVTTMNALRRLVDRALLSAQSSGIV